MRVWKSAGFLLSGVDFPAKFLEPVLLRGNQGNGITFLRQFTGKNGTHASGRANDDAAPFWM
jgi:hypothetical protein